MSNPPLNPAALGAALGRATLAMGLVLLGFAGYQLWGTGVAEATAQAELADRLAARLEASPPPAPVGRSGPTWLDAEPGLGPSEPDDAALVADRPGAAASPVGTTPAASPIEATTATAAPVAIGQPFARLRLPTIGVDKTVVEGTTREALRSGPGHYLGTARPGQPGNVAIAGHRTTYGAPFHDIDELTPGDPIVVETEDGVFTYRVEGQATAEGTTSGHRIVAPEAVHVIADRGDHRLTLTACHPKYSARQRIVVTAVLDRPVRPGIDLAAASPPGQDPDAEPDPDHEPDPVAAAPSPMTVSVRVPTPEVDLSTPPAESPAPPVPTAPDAQRDTQWEDGLGWQPDHAPATLLWALLSALVVATAWLAGRAWRPVPAYLMAVPSVALCLLTCFANLDRLIPAA